MVLLDCQLTEELKWGVPCYANGLLIQQTKNTQAARQIRFTHVREIVKLGPILKAYIFEAIEVEKAGLKVNFKKTTEFIIPEEFQKKLYKTPALKTAFYALTPGRQKSIHSLFFCTQAIQNPGVKG